MKKRILSLNYVRKLINQHYKNEITASRVTELLNERVYEFLEKENL